MNPVASVETAWRRSFEEVAGTPFLRLLSEGGLTRGHYLGFLRETYYNASMNPRLGSLFQAHLDSDRPALEARFLKHNASEIGHHHLALADLAALGGDGPAVRRGRPLPTTEALAAFAAFQIQHRHPLAYLGYLYHLEAIATTRGEAMMAVLRGLGIPANAMTFLQEHAEADVAHMQLNRDYIAGFVRTEVDLEAVVYGIQGACKLHGLMLAGVVEAEAHASPPACAPAAARN